MVDFGVHIDAVKLGKYPAICQKVMRGLTGVVAA